LIALLGIGLWLLAAGAGIGLFVYFLIKRLSDREKENFEKRKF